MSRSKFVSTLMLTLASIEKASRKPCLCLPSSARIAKPDSIHFKEPVIVTSFTCSINANWILLGIIYATGCCLKGVRIIVCRLLSWKFLSSRLFSQPATQFLPSRLHFCRSIILAIVAQVISVGCTGTAGV